MINIKDYSKEELSKLLWDMKERNELDFPFQKSSLDVVKESYIKLLNLSSEEIIKEGDWSSKYNYEGKKLQYYIDFNYFGLDASNYYFFDERMNCDSINSPSPYRVWNNRKFFDSLISSLYSLKLKDTSQSNLRTCFYLRKYVPGQFRPSAAKVLYDLFKPINTLDFSSGWGDRLIGFLSSKYMGSYTGIDPNSNLFPLYNELYNKFNIYNKKINLINNCAESVVSFKNKFDLIFTSPPYYNIERYTQDNNQSWKKYRKLEDWLKYFLFRSIENYWSCMESKAILAINISDVYSNHKINNICDPMNNFISKLPNSNYMGCLGYRIQKRLNSISSKKEGIICEPIWLWSNYKCSFFDYFS